LTALTARFWRLSAVNREPILKAATQTLALERDPLLYLPFLANRIPIYNKKGRGQCSEDTHDLS
jgi:hypothetical protein